MKEIYEISVLKWKEHDLIIILSVQLLLIDLYIKLRIYLEPPW